MKYIISLWKRIFDYKGTSGRKEFWVPFAVNAGIAVLMAALICVKYAGISWLAVPIIILAVYLAASAVPFVSLTVRRLHDTGRSGWWYWLVFAFGVGAIVLIMMLAGATQSFDPSENIAVTVYGPPSGYEDDYDPEDNINQDVYGPPEYFEDYKPEENVSVAVYGPPEWFETGTDTKPAETEISAEEPNTPVYNDETYTAVQTEAQTSETKTKETEPPEETAAEPEETETEQDISLEPFVSSENIMPAVYGPPDWFEDQGE